MTVDFSFLNKEDDTRIVQEHDININNEAKKHKDKPNLEAVSYELKKEKSRSIKDMNDYLNEKTEHIKRTNISNKLINLFEIKNDIFKFINNPTKELFEKYEQEIIKILLLLFLIYYVYNNISLE